MENLKRIVYLGAYGQVIRFLWVGGVNTLFGYSCYALFIFLGFDYKVAVLLATIIGVLFNYYTMGKYVFYSSGQGLIFKFILVYIIIYLVNIWLIGIFNKAGYNDYVSGLFSIIPCAVISFILNKFFVFRRKGLV